MDLSVTFQIHNWCMSKSISHMNSNLQIPKGLNENTQSHPTYSITVLQLFFPLPCILSFPLMYDNRSWQLVCNIKKVCPPQQWPCFSSLRKNLIQGDQCIFTSTTHISDPSLAAEKENHILILSKCTCDVVNIPTKKYRFSLRTEQISHKQIKI